MSKKKICFDISYLREFIVGNPSGIPYTAFYLFKEFAKDDDIDLCLYAKNCLGGIIEEYLRKLCGKDFKLYPVHGFKTRLLEKLVLKRKEYKEQRKKIRKMFLNIFKKLCIILLFEKKQEIPEFDVFFSPVNKISDEIKAKKKFVLLYDCTPLMYSECFKGVDWYYELVSSLNKDDYYFSISENTKKDFLKYCPELQDKHVTVALLACDKEKFKPVDKNRVNEVRKKYNIPMDKKYVFSLCNLDPRKNLIRSVKTFIEFIKKNKVDDMVFVLGGNAWKWFIKTLEKEISDLGDYKDKIIRAGYVADEDVAALYSGAEWFVYTSQYEGFGLPPLEAMSCGCPIITSNNSSLPEVVGDAGIMIDWDSDEQHIKAYEEYYYHPELREKNSAKGLKRAEQFSWEKCAKIMLDKMKED